MLTWTDAADSTPGHIPGVRFVDSTGRWTAARVGEDPRLGWCVWERREKRMVRLVPGVHIGSEAEAKAVAQVLSSHIARHAVRFAEVAAQVAAILVVRATRAVLSSTAEVVPPPRERTKKAARAFAVGESTIFRGERITRTSAPIQTLVPPKPSVATEARFGFEVDDREYVIGLLGDELLEVI